MLRLRLVGQPQRPIQCDPALHFRVDKVLLSAANLPDAVVGARPVVRPNPASGEVGPNVVSDRRSVLVVQINRIHQLAIDVELQLRRGGVADAHRTRAAIALQVVERFLGQFVAAVDSIHDLQWSAMRRPLDRALLQPAHKLLRLLLEAQPHKRIQRERRVPDPGVPVIPVAHAAEFLGETAGRAATMAPVGANVISLSIMAER